MVTRQPIITVMGHVDHGKTSLQDFIRESTMVAKEPGQITQHVGASIVPMNVIKKISHDLFKKINFDLKIPGLLFIDTPGHAAFTNLRKRGGNLADIAIVVIDINEGFKQQTYEVIEILKNYKVPFVIAANKIDKFPRFKSSEIGNKNAVSKHKKIISDSIIKIINSQEPAVITSVENRLYEIVGTVYEYGLQAERYDRVSDFTKQIPIIPISAITGEGIPDLLMIICALAQKFLTNKLEMDPGGIARGTILEVKKPKGLGRALDVILYEGTIQKGDKLLIAGVDDIIETKVKSLLQPAEMEELRDEKTKSITIQSAVASTGIKILANDIEDVIAGVSFVAFDEKREKDLDIKQIKKELMHEVKAIVTTNSNEGIVIKADTLGSLEAMTFIAQEKDIKISNASVGKITKKDIIDAQTEREKNEINSFILAFNTEELDSSVIDLAKENNIRIIKSPVIYEIIVKYEEEKETIKKLITQREIGTLTKPSKIKLLMGYTFRQSNPAVVGVEIVEGILYANVNLVNKEGKRVGTLKSIQKEKEFVNKCEKNTQVAVAIENATVGRNINEGDELYVQITEDEFKKYKNNKDFIDSGTKEVLKEFAEIMRIQNPLWGV
ncbi:MAG: translation initiation factor IF-2 [Candidatus Nanoarchaeia archaeon]|nr:translation initiation factor IF-2 [Candidatus Nanoarchaeia archaeon]